MRKNKRYIILVLLAVFFSGISCKKRPVDYRNKFCGDYIFIVIEESFTLSHGSFPAEINSTEGRIYYNKKEEKSTIHIEFGSGVAEGKINNNGVLDLCHGEGRFNGKASISFTANGDPCMSRPALGGHTNYNVKGEKK